MRLLSPTVQGPEDRAGVCHVAGATLRVSARCGPSEHRAACPHALLLSCQPGVCRAEKPARAGWFACGRLSHTHETLGFCARVLYTSTLSIMALWEGQAVRAVSRRPVVEGQRRGLVFLFFYYGKIVEAIAVDLIG